MRTGHLEFLWTDNAAGLPRREVQGSAPPLDLLVRARREAYAATFSALRSEVHAWRAAVVGNSDASG